MRTSVQPPNTPEDFIRRAAQCRRLASGAVPYTLARELEAIASEYEQRGLAGHAMPPESPRGVGALFSRLRMLLSPS